LVKYYFSNFHITQIHIYSKKYLEMLFFLFPHYIDVRAGGERRGSCFHPICIYIYKYTFIRIYVCTFEQKLQYLHMYVCIIFLHCKDMRAGGERMCKYSCPISFVIISLHCYIYVNRYIFTYMCSLLPHVNRYISTDTEIKKWILMYLYVYRSCCRWPTFFLIRIFPGHLEYPIYLHVYTYIHLHAYECRKILIWMYVNRRIYINVYICIRKNI
jgi:hypothetical protein